MYTQKMIKDWLAIKNTKYVFVIGYTGGEGYTDVMLQWGDNMLTLDQMDLYMDIYKPLEVRGDARDDIWCDAFDVDGYLDLPLWFNKGILKHYTAMGKLPKE